MKRSLVLGGPGALGLAVAKSLRTAGHGAHVTTSNGGATGPCSTWPWAPKPCSSTQELISPSGK